MSIEGMRRWEGEKVGEREGGRERERVNTSFSLNTEKWVWSTNLLSDLHSKAVRVNWPIWQEAGRWL